MDHSLFSKSSALKSIPSAHFLETPKETKVRHPTALLPAFRFILTSLLLLCALLPLASSYVRAESAPGSFIDLPGRTTEDDFDRLERERQRRHEAADGGHRKAGEGDRKEDHQDDKKNDPQKAGSIKNDPKSASRSVGRNAAPAREAGSRAMLWLLSAAATILLAASAGLIWALGPRRVCPKCNEKNRHWIKISPIQSREFQWRKRYKYHCFSCGFRWRDRRS